MFYGSSRKLSSVPYTRRSPFSSLLHVISPVLSRYGCTMSARLSTMLRADGARSPPAVHMPRPASVSPCRDTPHARASSTPTRLTRDSHSTALKGQGRGARLRRVPRARPERAKWLMGGRESPLPDRRCLGACSRGDCSWSLTRSLITRRAATISTLPHTLARVLQAVVAHACALWTAARTRSHPPSSPSLPSG